METLECFQQSQRIIEDFTSRTLAAIPNNYARLLYVASLRDLAGGLYHHEGLAALYPQAAVQQALAYCHEELFARILEMPLEQQEWDLRGSLAGLGGNFWEIVARWQELEFYRILIPSGGADYLRDLFFSNVRLLLALLTEEHATWEPAA